MEFSVYFHDPRPLYGVKLDDAMAPLSQTWFLLLFTLACLSPSLKAQNLVPNSSFEVFTFCPPGFGAGGPLQATPWQSGSGGTSDYLNVCANPATVGVPVNFFGNEPAHTGVAYGGSYYKYFAFEYREYLTCPLLSTLSAGVLYHISFYISLSDNNCGVDKMGVYFSNNAPIWPPSSHMPVTPQFEAQLGYLSNTDGWTLIDGCYTASGGERWITIGNFYDDANSPIDPNCPLQVNNSYYYVDDVSIDSAINIQNLNFDLGGPVQACDSFVIDPGLSGVSYFWSDGSHGPTLTVTESGTYALTISSGCDTGDDEIEVTISGSHPPVDLGPPQVDLCSGDSYTISLDPDAGDYTWQDGSTDPEYTITSTGTYSVTLDDGGCDQTNDQIQVDVIEPPASFDLGPDTYVCPGNEITYSFDPSLGNFLWNTGSTSSDYSIDIGGTYSLTISNMCGEYTDEIVVVDIAPPELEIGPDEINLCDGHVYDIVLDPNLGDYLWQDGSTSNEYSISLPGLYHVTVQNECGLSSDDLIVHGISDPVVDLGPDVSLCQGQLPYVLNVANSGATSFLWQDGSIDSTFEVLIGGAYAVTVTNECASISDDIEVTIQNSAVNVSLPPDQLLCQGESFVLQNTGDIGEYLWQDNSTGATYTVTSPGTYALTVTTVCGQGSDSVNISYLPPVAIPNLGPDFSLCPGQQFTLSPNIPGVSYLWQDGSTANNFVVNGPGTYYVQVSDLCTSATDTVVVNLNNNPPILSLPQQVALCQGSTITLDAAINGVNYQWSDGSQASTLTVNTPGTYSLTVSNTCGSDMDTVMVNDAGPSPGVALGNDIQLCPGNTVTINPVFSNVNSWLWNDGSTGSSFVVNGNQQVSVQVTNSCGTAFDTLQAVLLPATPPLSLGNDTSLCPGESLTLSINTPGVNIVWQDGSTNASFAVHSAGTYSATIANSCGSNADSIDIALLPPPPAFDLGPDQSLCPGEIIVVNPAIPGVNYLWQNGSTSTSFNATQAGTIILTLSNSCGSDTDSLEIIENTQGPQIDLGPDILACSGDVVTLQANVSGVQYLWQDGSTSSDFTTSSSGTFILQVSNNCGTDRDTVQVDISGTPPNTNLGPDTTLCKGITFLLTSTSDPGTMLQWQDGTGNPTFLVSSAGLYTLAESNHCGSHRDSIQVDYLNPPAAFDLGPDLTLCPDESIMLIAPPTTDKLLWQDGSSGNFFFADKAQTYTLQISNDCGAVSDALTLTYDNHIPVVALDSLSNWCPGNMINLDVTQPFPASYSWSTGSTQPSIQITAPGHYEVSVATLCFDVQDSTIVIENPDCFPTAFYIPTVFSPNDDNINDVFSIQTNQQVEITKSSGQVFDRWGNLVYSSTDIPFTWNGRFKDNPLQPGVYVYHFTINYVVNGLVRTEDFTGDVTIVK